jgi:thiopeptide-type bacteriocin biosynthesis protein
LSLDNDGTAPSPWLEVRCALFPRMDAPGQFVPWAALHDALEQWRAERRYESFFFVRKPPGLRLRFVGGDLGTQLEPVLLPWLTGAEARNDVRGFRFAVYEPEEARFGGPVGMAIAHDAFDRDSCDAMRYESMSDDRRGGVSRVDLSVAICGDLFLSCLGDRAEIWDVWQRLLRVIERNVPAATGKVPGRLDARPPHAAPDLADLSPELRALVEARLADNRSVAATIVAARDAGRLTVGLRSWLTAVAIFHWNRLFLSPSLDELAAAVSAQCRVLEPDR